MVKSIECSGHVESSQNCDFSRVNSFHDVVREFEQSSLSRMEFAVGRLQRAETGRYRYVREKTSLLIVTTFTVREILIFE